MNFHDWITNENNPSLAKSQYLYGARHIAVLMIVAASCIVLSLIFRKKSEEAKRKLFLTFAWIFLFFEIASRIVNLAITNDFSLENIAKIILPMHICSVMVWIFIVAIFTKKRILLEFSVVGGFLATIAFLLYPAVGLNKVYMSFTCLYSTITHMCGFVCVVLLMTLGKVKFEFKRLHLMLICFAVMFLWGALLDFVIFPGSDYMYLRNDPLELALPFPYHLLYLVILLAYISLFYVIPAISRKLKERRNKNV